MKTKQPKGCPWCGAAPAFDTQKYHNAGEPYVVVKIGCKACGAWRGFVFDTDRPEHRALYDAARATEKTLQPYYLTYLRAAMPQLIKMWNKRQKESL